MIGKSEKEINQIQLQCLEKALSNLEIKKIKDFTRNNSEQEKQRLEDYYNSAFDRVNKEKQELLKKLNQHGKLD